MSLCPCLFLDPFSLAFEDCADLACFHCLFSLIYIVLMFYFLSFFF